LKPFGLELEERGIELIKVEEISERLRERMIILTNEQFIEMVSLYYPEKNKVFYLFLCYRGKYLFFIILDGILVGTYTDKG